MFLNKPLVIFFSLLFSINFLNLNAQEDEEYNDTDTLRFHEVVDVEDFKDDLFNEILLYEINRHRRIKGLDSIVSNTILKNAAEDQSEYMAVNEDAIEFQTGQKKDTRSRLIFYGGSGVGNELIAKLSAKKGADNQSYKQLADEVFFKWIGAGKTAVFIEDPECVFIGQGASIDYNGKKIYVSAVFGNYTSFNEGLARRDELDVPFTKKKHGLKRPDAKICKKCEKASDIEEMQKGLYVKDGFIYFKYNDLKNLKKIIKNSGDGIAVDVVQKAQYPCIGANIINNSNPIKGIPSKKLFSSKLYKNNLITDKKESKVKIDVCIGPFPKKLAHLNEDEYELNLIIILDKRICRNIYPYFDLKGDIAYDNPLDLLADTVTFGQGADYTPKATSSTLNFKIPFDQAKFTYEKEDIEPFLLAMKEPEFTIQELNIHAFSSIEGNEQQNEVLQKKRAESIIKSLNDRQKSIIPKTNITTGENWDEFVRDISGTEFSNMSSMTINEAQNYIRDKGLAKKMEPILTNHRYAQITMLVKYEIEGKNEQKYVVKMFNDAVKKYDAVEALSIQKYIFKKVVAGVYDSTAVFDMEIPESSKFAGILMNKLWLERFVNKEDLSEECCRRVEKLNQLDPNNDYIKFNQLYCNFIYKPIKDEAQVAETQAAIEALYQSTLSKETIDNMNLEYQFFIINAMDTVEQTPTIVLESLERIKQIVNVKDANWQNSLKLAYIFMGQKEYDFAAKLLEPFIEKKVVFEELVFLYLSLCSRSPARVYSNRFVTANKRAYQLNPERYCQLFDGTKFSVQILENTLVKEIYCKKCKQ